MGCNCGGNSSTLGNYTIKLPDGTKVEKTAITETEAKAFAAKTTGATWTKKS